MHENSTSLLAITPPKTLLNKSTWIVFMLYQTRLPISKTIFFLYIRKISLTTYLKEKKKPSYFHNLLCVKTIESLWSSMQSLFIDLIMH